MTCAQVADFLNADVGTWACMLASFLLGRPHGARGPSSSVPTQDLSLEHLLLSLPSCLLPTVLSYASHRPLAEKLAWITAVGTPCSPPLHPTNNPDHLKASVVHASLKPHPSDPSLGIAITDTELSTHAAALAATPQLEWLQVRCSAPQPPTDHPQPTNHFPALRSATLVATTAAAAPPSAADDATAAVAEALACIAAGPALHHLTIEQHRVALNLTRKGMALVATQLAALRHLRRLELPGCGIGPHATQALGTAVAFMPALTLLNLDHNPLDGHAPPSGRPERAPVASDRCDCGDGFEGLLHIYSSQPGHAHGRPRLRHLSLLGVCYHPRGAHAFQQLVSHLPTLEDLAISELGLPTHTLMTLTTLPALTALAVSNTSPRICDVVTHLRGLRSFRPRGFTGTPGLAAVFRSLPGLRHVDLGGHHLPAGCLEDLEGGLGGLRDLQTLTLGHSYIGDTGARALMRVLTRTPRLTELTLPHATVAAAVAPAAGAAIAGLPDLQVLRFAWVFHDSDALRVPSGGTAGMPEFAQALSGAACASLHTLVVSGAVITTAAAAAALAGALAGMPALRDLTLRHWACHDMHVMVPFAAHLPAMAAISRLDLSFCSIAEPCLVHVITQLPHMPALAALHLPREGLSCVATRALAAELPSMPALFVLDGLSVGALDAATVEELAAAVAQVPKLDVPLPLRVSAQQWAVIAERGPALLRLLSVPHHS